jgi:hypothetical protein
MKYLVPPISYFLSLAQKQAPPSNYLMSPPIYFVCPSRNFVSPTQYLVSPPRTFAHSLTTFVPPFRNMFRLVLALLRASLTLLVPRRALGGADAYF